MIRFNGPVIMMQFAIQGRHFHVHHREGRPAPFSTKHLDYKAKSTVHFQSICDTRNHQRTGGPLQNMVGNLTFSLSQSTIPKHPLPHSSSKMTADYYIRLNCFTVEYTQTLHRLLL